MSKPTIHFVYTVPLGSNIFRRAIDKALRHLHFTPLHRYGIDFLIPWKKPIRAPHSISYHLLHELKKHGRIRFYSIYEKGIIHLNDRDIFIGQPLPLGGFTPNGRPDKDDAESVTSATLRAYAGSSHLKALIMPFADDPLLVSWAKDLVEKYADKVILIGGDIWLKNWEQSPFGKVNRSKVLRVDMGIDMNDYPRVKTSFNSAGKRKYLYIGHTAWYKNTKELEHIAATMPGFVGGHIGTGNVVGWKKIADFADLTPEFMATICKEYDIFVNTSTGDAQATTILEQMCFGMVVACTPESGYGHPSLIQLKTNDTAWNIQKLQELQMMDEKELLAIAEKNRETATQFHSWDKFCKKISDFIF